MVEVVSVQYQDFGERFGDGWFVRFMQGEREREVAVLRSMWETTYQPKHRGLTPRSIREKMEDFCDEDMIQHGAAIDEVVSEKIERWEKKKGKAPWKWLVDIWRAVAAREVGAFAMYLKMFLANVDSGYAITCHPAQGSQYAQVMVVADMVDFIADGVAEDVYRWSYTALTRAV